MESVPAKGEDNKETEEHVKGAGTVLASSAIVDFSGINDCKHGKMLKLSKIGVAEVKQGTALKDAIEEADQKLYEEKKR